MSSTSTMKSKPLMRKLVFSSSHRAENVNIASSDHGMRSQSYHASSTTYPTTPDHKSEAHFVEPVRRRRSSFYSQSSVIYSPKFTNPSDWYPREDVTHHERPPSVYSAAMAVPAMTVQTEKSLAAPSSWELSVAPHFDGPEDLRQIKNDGEAVIHDLEIAKQHLSGQPNTHNALLRGLKQTYGPSSKVLTDHARQQQQYLSSNIPFKPSLWSTEPLQFPLKIRQYNAPPAPPGAKILITHTRDPRKYSNQGKFMGIGTMRAISPAGVAMLQGWLMASLRKTGGMERGVKEVRKWLRDQDRKTVEWVAEWLYYRWGCEL